MNKISGFLLLIAALIVPSIAFADLAQHKRTCSSIGFTAGTEPHGDCVLRLVKIETGVRDEALETDSRSEEYLQQQAEDLRYLRRQAERQEQNAKLDTMLNLLAPLTGGGNTAAPPSHQIHLNNRENKPDTGGLWKTCSYGVSGAIASHTIQSDKLCPLSMYFGREKGLLRN